MRPFDPRLRPHLAPARGHLVGVVAAGVLGGALLIAQAFVVADLVVGLLAAPRGAGWHDAAWWLLGISLARAAVGAAGDLLAAGAASRITVRLRARVLRAALDLGADVGSRRRTGELSLLGTRGVAAVEPYVTRYLPTMVVATVLPPATLVVIGLTDRWAGLIVLLTLPLVPVFAILIGLATRDRADRQYRTLSVLAGHFLDVVRGLPTLVTYNRAGFQSGRIRSVTDRYRRATLETLKLAFASSAALELIATLSVALVAVSVGLRLATGDLGFRTALVLLLLAPEAYWPLRRVGTEFHAAAEGVATFEAIDHLLDEAAGASTPTAASTSEDRVDPVPIVLDDLVVRYPGATAPALQLDRAVIPATGVTAIVGPSGAGKSTLVQVLLGELGPDQGSVTLAGEPIDLDTWHRVVAQVPQTPWLTALSVAENLRIGRPGATTTELWQVLADVDLDAVVVGLPSGLDTALGEDGAGFSAGQRARLALARVILANRPYVVLDEPTAHLDARTEAILIETLTRLAQTATVVVVAHSAAVVAAADHVITLRSAVAPALEPQSFTAPTIRSSTALTPEPEQPAIEPGPARPGRRLALGTLLGTLASLSGVALTATAGWLIARAAEQPPVLMLMVAIVGVRTFGLARPVLRYAERLVSHDVALRMLADTRARVYDLLVPLAPARLGRRRGDVLSSVVDDVDAELDDLLRVRQPLWTWLGVGVVSTTAAFLIDPVAALPVAGLCFGIGGAAVLLSRTGARRAAATFVDLRAQISDELVADVQSARQLVLWQADASAVRRLDDLGLRMGTSLRRSALAVALGRALLTAGAGAAVLVTAWTVAPDLADGAVSGPMTALLLLLPLALADALAGLPEIGTTAVQTAAARERLAHLAALQPAVVEPLEPLVLDTSGALELHGASVGWTDVPVLSDLDLTLQPGTALGVVGASGCGKSTLAALLVRHLAPSRGRYLLAGADTAALGSAEVRRHVGLVDDDPYVFASTVRENLRLARPDATDEELLAALCGAGLAPWFAERPDGLDTRLGDGASGVSGGERARIGIARALLHDPEVLVLDEPTAHLDTATARAVSEVILAARAGRSLIWITHDQVGLGALDAVWDLTSPGTSLRSPGSPAPRPPRSHP